MPQNAHSSVRTSSAKLCFVREEIVDGYEPTQAGSTCSAGHVEAWLLIFFVSSVYCIVTSSLNYTFYTIIGYIGTLTNFSNSDRSLPRLSGKTSLISECRKTIKIIGMDGHLSAIVGNTIKLNKNSTFYFLIKQNLSGSFNNHTII